MHMSKIYTGQLGISHAASSPRRKRSIMVVLWTVQVALALLFLFAGGMKLLLPMDVLLAQMAVPLPGLFIRFIGVIEVAGALGLVLPGLTRIKPWLTPLAACGLALEMIGATTITVIGMGAVPALLPLIVGLLAGCVAYGRRPRGHAA
jgi:tellurite resistance protein TehA-like permease